MLGRGSLESSKASGATGTSLGMAFEAGVRHRTHLPMPNEVDITSSSSGHLLLLLVHMLLNVIQR